MKKSKTLKLILILSSTVLVLGTTIFAVFAWYVDKGNFYVDSSEMATYKEAYCNHIHGKNTSLTASAYSTGGTPKLSETMEPGDLIYYAFIMDYSKEDSSSSCTMTIDLEMSYVFPENDDSILSNLTIQANTVSVYQATRSGTDAYTYTPASSKTSTTNTEVSTFSETEVEFTLSVPALNLTENGYLMIYIPVWYKDTGALQNNEKVSQITFTKAVLDF